PMPVAAPSAPTMIAGAPPPEVAAALAAQAAQQVQGLPVGVPITPALPLASTGTSVDRGTLDVAPAVPPPARGSRLWLVITLVVVALAGAAVAVLMLTRGGDAAPTQLAGAGSGSGSGSDAAGALGSGSAVGSAAVALG